MKKILYIHGFASSGASGTIVMLRNILYDAGVQIIGPDLPSQPAEAIALLRQTVAEEQPDLIIGTSMGGFYAALLTGYKRILVNPSFHMSKTLMFKGMLGKQKWLNKRADGATEFKVDKTTVAQFKELEKELFKDKSDAEKANVYGLFGKNDTFVNYRDEYTDHYGKEHFILFDGEHQLNEKVLKKVVLPLVNEMLELK